MMSEFDQDGFYINDNAWEGVPIKAPPPIVEMPHFFAGCLNTYEANVKMINELKKSFSIGQHGMDELYQRLSNALILILANQIGIEP